MANRAFGAVGPVATPVKLAHDTISTGAYAAVRGIGGGLARTAGTAAALAQRAGAPPLTDSPALAPALGALSGAFGDTLESQANPLAFRMGVRSRGCEVTMASEEAARAFPDAGPRVAIFCHGLCETEASWHLGAERHYGDASVWHGSRLREDTGFSPVTVRVNSGLHISENGRRLAELLEQLHDSGRCRSKRSCWLATRWAG